MRGALTRPVSKSPFISLAWVQVGRGNPIAVAIGMRDAVLVFFFSIYKLTPTRTAFADIAKRDCDDTGKC